jgi:hypothetical protein
MKEASAVRLLVERLREIKEGSDGDAASDHREADQALVEFIGDVEVKWAFEDIIRHY